jgi:putative FmdB family regulatory protein
MPIYEYACHGCGERFEALVYGAERPSCPRCGDQGLEKLLSAFAVGRGGAPAALPPGCRVPAGGG